MARAFSGLRDEKFRVVQRFQVNCGGVCSSLLHSHLPAVGVEITFGHSKCLWCVCSGGQHRTRSFCDLSLWLCPQSIGTRLKTTARGWVTSPSSGDRSKRSLLCSVTVKSIVSCFIFTWFACLHLLFLSQFVLTSFFSTFQIFEQWSLVWFFFPHLLF